MLSNVAIVIPVGPGDTAWGNLMPQLKDADAQETLVVLAEGDVAILDKIGSGLAVIHAPPGRASQLNAGVSASTADWLWFLHADSSVTSRTLEVMREFVRMDQDAIGYFHLGFLDDGPRWMFVNAWGARLRSRLFGMPFGDQGLLLPRRVFRALGGFDESVGKGEDHALIWNAHAHGIPLRPLNATIRTSARRFAEYGWLRTTWQHLRLTRAQAADFSRKAHARANIKRA